MTTDIVPTLQSLLKETARIREESYVTSDAPVDTFLHPGSYTKDLKQAADEACASAGADPRLAQLLYLALEGWWNDTLAWADDASEYVPTDDQLDVNAVAVKS